MLKKKKTVFINQVGIVKGKKKQTRAVTFGGLKKKQRQLNQCRRRLQSTYLTLTALIEI